MTTSCGLDDCGAKPKPLLPMLRRWAALSRIGIDVAAVKCCPSCASPLPNVVPLRCLWCLWSQPEVRRG